MTDLVKLYNPANAASLTPEQLEGLQKLDSPQIKELAVAYPNLTMQRAYLLIVDSKLPAHKQLPQLSTFENLWNLREKNAQRHWVAFGFRGNYKNTVVKNVLKARKTEVLDLSDTELMSLPGFKKVGEGGIKEVVVFEKESIRVHHDPEGEPLKVKVTKIKKVPIEKATKAPKKTKSK